MKIERERVRETFREYTDAYDATDEKIKLKIDHTYRVAELCERIAKAEQMEKTEVDLAWLLGMLHDVGRFEQLRRYGTFSDADSIDHAALGADILFGGVLREGEGLIRTYVDDAAEDEVIETAIRVHSAYRIPEGLAPRTEKAVPYPAGRRQDRYSAGQCGCAAGGDLQYHDGGTAQRSRHTGSDG